MILLAFLCKGELLNSYIQIISFLQSKISFLQFQTMKWHIYLVGADVSGGCYMSWNT